jgi:hydroxymethylglutaryl-CoA reductase
MVNNNVAVSGYSKLTRTEKIDLLPITEEDKKVLAESIVHSVALQELIDDLSENTISNFVFPFGIAPNVVLNGKNYFLPLVTEESSVVAAISKSSKFWSKHGGFHAKVLGTTKKGNVHFFWLGNKEQLFSKFPEIKLFVNKNLASLTLSMEKRGGGITNINLQDNTHLIPHYYSLDVDFETIDAMGANFINTCLEEMATSFKRFVATDASLDSEHLEVNMAILSNYTPDCFVYVKASCSVDDLNAFAQTNRIENFAEKFVRAVKIAKEDVNRAVTHNKGIFNGIDAVLLATANDWRAVEACAHAYASRNGKYSSLSNAYIQNSEFTLEMTLPLAVGTVGGVTNLHPMAKLALDILGKPSAAELMQIIAVSGLAANFSAVAALISSGIQKGHMKMHMSNLNRQKNV